MSFPLPKDKKVLVCILLDGLGYDLVKQISFLSDLFEDVRPLKTVLGYSCAAQASILTGLSPVGHGGLCVYYRSTKSIFGWMRILPFLPKRYRERLLKKTVSLTRRFFRITGHFDIWQIPVDLLSRFQLYERKGFYLRCPIKGVKTILDEAWDKEISISSYYWNTPQDQIFSKTEDKLINHQSDFHFLYISRTDHLLHIKGTNPGTVGKELDIYADRIRRIYRIAKENYHKVGLMVFSDHGMLNVTGKVDVMSPISKLPYRLGSDYLAFYDATMVRFWFNSLSCKQAIMDTMEDIEGIRLLSDHELEELGSLFPDRRYGEAMYLVEGGKVISPCFFGSLENIKGMHGYHPLEPGYEAFVASKNIDINAAKMITDLFWIMKQCILQLRLA